MALKTWHKIIAVVLCVSFIMGMSCFFAVSAEESKGTISADNVNIRTSAGTGKDNFVRDSSGNKIQLSTGHKVTVLQTVKSTTDKTYVTWY